MNSKVIRSLKLPLGTRRFLLVLSALVLGYGGLQNGLADPTAPVATTSAALGVPETKDIRDGVAFAQKALKSNPGASSLDLGDQITKYQNSDDLAKRSPYFKLGADYEGYKLISAQVNAGLAATKDDSDQEVYRELGRNAWDAFHDDLTGLKLSPKQFADAIGAKDVESILASDPYPEHSGASDHTASP